MTPTAGMPDFQGTAQKPGLRGWLLMSPLLLWMAAFVVAPTLIMLVDSFCQRDERGQVVCSFCLASYKRLVVTTEMEVVLLRGV